MNLSRPGKPNDNAYIKAFNSKLRSEFPNAQWFMGLEDTVEELEAWLRDYSEEIPLSAIGYIVPIDMHHPDGITGPSS